MTKTQETPNIMKTKYLSAPVTALDTSLVTIAAWDSRSRAISLRDCFKIAWGPAARDFGCGQGDEDRASPQRAVRSESTLATDKRPAPRRVFAEKAGWLRCFSVGDHCGYPPSRA